MKKITLLLLIFSGTSFCNSLTVTADYKKIIQQFLQHKQQQVKDNPYLAVNALFTKTTLTSQEEKELKSLLNKLASTSVINQIYFGQSGLLHKALQMLLQRKNFDAFNSVTTLNKAVKQLINNDPNYRTLRDAQLKQLKEDLVALEKEIPQITNQKFYQLILKGLLTTLGITGLTTALYKFIKSTSSRACDNQLDSSSGTRRRKSSSFPSVESSTTMGTTTSLIRGSCLLNPIPIITSIFSSRQTEQQKLASDLITLLENNDIDIDKKIDQARALIGQGADINFMNNRGQTPLWVATQIGSRELVKLLLEYKADVNATNLEGWTPLAWATARKMESIIMLLIQYNANPITKAKDGTSPLHWATYGKLDQIIRLFLKGGASIHAPDNKGSTPLYWLHNDEEYLKRILQKPLIQAIILNNPTAALEKEITPETINQQDDDGMTPLHWAMAQANVIAVNKLIQAGADINIRTYDKNHYGNLTALELAQFLLITAKHNSDKIAVDRYRNITETYSSLTKSPHIS
jgi:ankyrin repeat protein